MTWFVAQGGSPGSGLGRIESKRPFSVRRVIGMSSGGVNSQEWWVMGWTGIYRVDARNRPALP